MKKLMVLFLVAVVSTVFVAPVQAKVSIFNKVKRKIDSLLYHENQKYYLAVEMKDLGKDVATVKIISYRFAMPELYYKSKNLDIFSDRGSRANLLDQKTPPRLVARPMQRGDWYYGIQKVVVADLLYEINQVINNSDLEIKGGIQYISSETLLAEVEKRLKAEGPVMAQHFMNKYNKEYPELMRKSPHWRIVGGTVKRPGIMQAIIWSKSGQVAKAKKVLNRLFKNEAVLNTFISYGYLGGLIFHDMQLLSLTYVKDQIAMLSEKSWDFMISKKNMRNRKFSFNMFNGWSKTIKYIMIIVKGGKTNKYLTRK